MIAAGGSRTVAAEAAGISRGTIYGWLRRGTEDAKTTQTVLDPDDYTAIELRTMAHGAGIPGFSRIDKAELAAAVAAKPSEYLHFLNSIKKTEAEAENEWLNGVARIARGAGVTTTVTEEIDASGNVKTRTTRTVTGLGSWQAYAWLLERRHPERIQPDHRVLLFEAKQNHIVIRGDHYLVGSVGIIDDHPVGGAPIRGPVFFMPDITHLVSELPQRVGHPPRKILVE